MKYFTKTLPIVLALSVFSVGPAAGHTTDNIDHAFDNPIDAHRFETDGVAFSRKVEVSISILNGPMTEELIDSVDKPTPKLNDNKHLTRVL